MPTPRKPKQPAENSSRSVPALVLLALLLIGGWVWMQYDSPLPPKPINESIATIDSLATETVRDTAKQDVTEITPIRPPDLVKEATVKKAKKPEVTPPAAPQPRLPPATEKPAASVKLTEPAIKPVEKPAPPVCDRLVLRSGDLIDVVVSEIGVNEIRYKRCRWKDGPNYVVAKTDVLSIHFANGDVERF